MPEIKAYLRIETYQNKKPFVEPLTASKTTSVQTRIKTRRHIS